MLPRLTVKAGRGAFLAPRPQQDMASRRSRGWWQTGGQYPNHHRPPALPHPPQMTPKGPSVFLPLSCPPLAGLLSVQQPQIGKLNSGELGTQLAEQPGAERLRAPGSILSTEPGAFSPRGLGYSNSLVRHLFLGQLREIIKAQSSFPWKGVRRNLSFELL